MKRYVAIQFVAAVCVCGGCALPQLKAESKLADATDVTALTYPASVRGTYMKPAKSETAICAEPAPDAGNSESLKAAVALMAQAANEAVKTSTKTEGSGSFEHSVQVVELAGRSELVLVVREALYRVCEATFNNPAMAANDRIDLYKSVLTSIKDVAEAIKAAELAKKADAEKAREKAEKEKLQAAAMKLQAEGKEAEFADLKDGERAAALVLAKQCTDTHSTCLDKASTDGDKTQCNTHLVTCLRSIRAAVSK